MELVHEDYAHIQKKLVPEWLEDPASMELSTVMKGGMRNGGIQLALKTDEGVNWYRAIIPSIVPRIEGSPGYRFFGPGQKPFYNYKATTVETEHSVNPDTVKKLIRGFNPTLREGFLAVSVIHSSKDRVVLRLRVGGDLVAKISELDNTINYCLGTMDLHPLFGDDKVVEPMELAEEAE